MRDFAFGFQRRLYKRQSRSLPLHHPLSFANPPRSRIWHANNRMAGARKSEISVATCRGGFAFADSTRRGGAGGELSGISSGLGRTRPIIENAPSHATEKRRRPKRSTLLGARQTGRRRERPAVAAVRHAIRQKIVARARGQDGRKRVGARERRRGNGRKIRQEER